MQYEGASVNSSEIYIESKTCYIRIWEKHLFSRHIFHHLSSSATFERPWENFSTQLWTVLRDNTFQRKQETVIYKCSLHWDLSRIKKHKRTVLFCSKLLKHGLHFDYWNQPLNMRMRIYYIGCPEAGLCCYVVIHLENILRPLQLFYFRLWPIHWLCLVF
jgi:hypothetical protein